MRKTTLTLCAIALLLFACNNEKKGDEKVKDDDAPKKEQAWIPIDSAAAMKAMMAAGVVGEEHKMLAKSNGTWEADMTYWDGIDRPAMQMKGTTVTTSILDGHFQQSNFSGEFMGAPFNGISIVGYENTTKEFVSIWMENMRNRFGV